MTWKLGALKRVLAMAWVLPHTLFDESTEHSSKPGARETCLDLATVPPLLTPSPGGGQWTQGIASQQTMRASLASKGQSIQKQPANRCRQMASFSPANTPAIPPLSAPSTDLSANLTPCIIHIATHTPVRHEEIIEASALQEMAETRKLSLSSFSPCDYMSCYGR